MRKYILEYNPNDIQIAVLSITNLFNRNLVRLDLCILVNMVHLARWPTLCVWSAITSNASTTALLFYMHWECSFALWLSIDALLQLYMVFLFGFSQHFGTKSTDFDDTVWFAFILRLVCLLSNSTFSVETSLFVTMVFFRYRIDP